MSRASFANSKVERRDMGTATCHVIVPIDLSASLCTGCSPWAFGNAHREQGAVKCTTERSHLRGVASHRWQKTV